MPDKIRFTYCHGDTEKNYWASWIQEKKINTA